ncbi:hypothetical protein [Streptomyces violaceorubidus]|uniref:hypothetical protein n=1 Tax=Streptomyces violaceorubidus TaxID=284042 RepID=UPI000AA66B60|nr:hypothetical protein [Streptomyces violaceorubidus]
MTPSSAGPADLVVTGCTVLVHDDRERIGFEQDAAVVVRDGVVDSVTTAAAGAAAASEWTPGSAGPRRGRAGRPRARACGS